MVLYINTLYLNVKALKNVGLVAVSREGTAGARQWCAKTRNPHRLD
jgi:hypothetical protein